MFHAEKDTHEEEDMERQKRQGAEYEFYGKLPLKKAIPLGLQHVLAMFVGNLTPILIISGACGIAGEEFGSLQVDLLQNAMLIAGIVTLIQLFAIGPVGGKVPIIMGTSSGFIGVFNSVVQVMGDRDKNCCAEHSKHMLKAEHNHFAGAELASVINAILADFYF